MAIGTEGEHMLKDFENAVRQFQEALREAGIVGDVEVTLPREPMQALYREWLVEPVLRFEPVPQFDRSCFCMVAPGGLWTFRHAKKPTADVDLRAKHAADAVNIPATVTLEGLAAVIGALSGALSTIAHENKDTKSTLAALNKAAEMVTELLNASGQAEAIRKGRGVNIPPKGLWTGAPDAEQPVAVAVGMDQFSESAVRIAEDAAYNRAITDAHNAMADEFGITSDNPDGIRAQAAIRKLYRRTS